MLSEENEIPSHRADKANNRHITPPVVNSNNTPMMPIQQEDGRVMYIKTEMDSAELDVEPHFEKRKPDSVKQEPGIMQSAEPGSSTVDTYDCDSAETRKIDIEHGIVWSTERRRITETTRTAKDTTDSESTEASRTAIVYGSELDHTLEMTCESPEENQILSHVREPDENSSDREEENVMDNTWDPEGSDSDTEEGDTLDDTDDTWEPGEISGGKRGSSCSTRKRYVQNMTSC